MGHGIAFQGWNQEMLVLRVDRTDHEGAELLPVRGLDWRKGSRYQRGIEAVLHPHGLGRPAFQITHIDGIKRTNYAEGSP